MINMLTNLLLFILGFVLVGIPLVAIVWVYKKYLVKTVLVNEKPWDWKTLKTVLVIECLGFGALSFWLLIQVFSFQ